MSQRHIRRDEWLTLHDKTYARERILFRGAEAEAQLMHIGRADEPFCVPGRNGRVVIADAGYCWLQIAPVNGHWWMTAMYTPAGEPVQYYFDITAGNRVSEGKDADFEDLYLDYVLDPDGMVTELDRDELQSAFVSGTVTRETFDLAIESGEALKQMLNTAPMAEFDAIYARLRKIGLRNWAQL